MSFVGLDVIAIRALSRQFEAYAQDIDALSRELTAALDTLEWFGEDQIQFAEEWNLVHRISLVRAAKTLNEASRLAHESAAVQAHASDGH
jgi:uncharacterized protein YukE